MEAELEKRRGRMLKGEAASCWRIKRGNEQRIPSPMRDKEWKPTAKALSTLLNTGKLLLLE